MNHRTILLIHKICPSILKITEYTDMYIILILIIVLEQHKTSTFINMIQRFRSRSHFTVLSYFSKQEICSCHLQNIYYIAGPLLYWQEVITYKQCIGDDKANLYVN